VIVSATPLVSPRQGFLRLAAARTGNVNPARIV
jgi:hypothetical protein